MKQNFWKFTFIAACVCASGLTARAAALARADVIANPGWILHLDCDGLRPTVMGKYMLDELDKPEMKGRLGAFQTIFGFDIRNQVHGITLFGASQAPQDGVILVYADFDPNRLVTLAQGAQDYQSTPYKQQVIHSWADKRNGGQGRVYAAFQGNRAIFGQREDRVTAVLDVLNAGAPSLAASSSFPGVGTTGSGHFIEAAARKMDTTNLPPNAAILKLAKTIQLVVGEKNEQMTGTLTVETDSDDAALQMFNVTQGLTALMKMQAANNPKLQKFADAMAITQDGVKIVGNLNLSANDVVDMMKAFAAQRAAIKAAAASAEKP